MNKLKFKFSKFNYWDNLERKELLAIAEMPAWESETIRTSSGKRKLMQLRAYNTAQRSAIREETKTDRLSDDYICTLKK